MTNIENGNGITRNRVKFDPTVNLGHIMSAGVFLATTIAAWVSLDARIAQSAKDILRVESTASRDTTRSETLLLINEVQAEMNRTQVRTSDDVREIKQTIRDGFRDLDAKLGSKADKPR